MSIKYIINFDVKNECLADFKNILDSVKTELPQTEGCVSVIIYNDMSNENKFTLIETWKGKKHHEDHVRNLIDCGAWDSILTHLTCLPTGAYFEKVIK